MTTLEIKRPFPHFTAISGDALESGKVYIGVAGLDAETNPVSVYWDVDATILAVQPIRTISGTPSRLGAAAAFYSTENYSITVRDSDDTLVYSRLLAVSDNLISSLSAAARVFDNTTAVIADTTMTYDLNQPNTVTAGDSVQTRDGKFYVVLNSGVTGDIQNVNAVPVQMADMQARTANSMGLWAAKADGTLFTSGGLNYIIDSSVLLADSCTKDLGVAGIEPDGVRTAEHHGADFTGVADSLQALTDAAAHGDFTATGTYHMTGVLALGYTGANINFDGATFDNTVMRLNTDISISGRVTVNAPSAAFGWIDVKGQNGTAVNVDVLAVAGVGYKTGGTYRAQVTVSNISVNVKSAGILVSHDHGAGGIIGYTRPDFASTVPVIASGGTGYEDGQWIAPLTGGSGSGAVALLTVDGGIVTAATVIHGGKSYVAIETGLTFDIATAVKSTQTATIGMTGSGSGFSLTVGDVMDTATYFNENHFSLTANTASATGTYAGILGHGKYNYNKARVYIEGLWTRAVSPVLMHDTPVSNVFEFGILVNAGVGETTNAATLLVDLVGGVGNTVLGKRSGNPYSTAMDTSTLANFGINVGVVTIDLFSGVNNSRGLMKAGDVKAESLYIPTTLNQLPAANITMTASGGTTGHTIAVDVTTPLAATTNVMLFDVSVYGRRAGAGGTATSRHFGLSVKVVLTKSSTGVYTATLADGGSPNATPVSVAASATGFTVTFDTTNTMTTAAQWRSIVLVTDFGATDPNRW